MRVLLLGATGQVGRELGPRLGRFAEVLTPRRDEIDLDRPAEAAGAVAALRPDVIVNAAAFNDVDGAERDEGEATRVNGEAVGAIGEVARELGALLIHFSTNFVFDGKAARAYREDDAPAPLSAYGRSKLAGERALAAIDAPAIVLRTCWVYGLEGRSFVGSMLAAAREREVIEVADDQVGSPTAAADLAAAVAELLRAGRRDELVAARGVHHLAGEGAASKLELARAAIALDPRRHEHTVREVVAVPTSHFGPGAPRPRHAPLDSTRIAARLGVSLGPWRQGLAHVLEGAT